MGVAKRLPKTVTEDAVREHFAACGRIQNLRLPQNSEGQAKGVAFITFQTAEALANAIELDGKKFGDVTLVVEKAGGAEKGKGKSKGQGKGDGKGKKGASKDKGKGKKGKSKDKE